MGASTGPRFAGPLERSRGCTSVMLALDMQARCPVVNEMRWPNGVASAAGAISTGLVSLQVSQICCTCGHFRSTELECAMVGLPLTLFGWLSAALSGYFLCLAVRPRSARRTLIALLAYGLA